MPHGSARITMKLLLSLLLLPYCLATPSYAGDSFLTKGQSLKSAKAAIIAKGWKPVRNVSERLTTEEQLYRSGYQEVVGCAMDIGQCILLYRDRKRRCLSLYVSGEDVKRMTVVGWDERCQ